MKKENPFPPKKTKQKQDDWTEAAATALTKKRKAAEVGLSFVPLDAITLLFSRGILSTQSFIMLDACLVIGWFL